MIVNRYDEMRNIIKELEAKNIYVNDLYILNEIDYALERELTEKEYDTLYGAVSFVCMKTELISLHTIVRCAMDNLDKILNKDENFDFLKEACWYE